jgi:hypothetical protein
MSGYRVECVRELFKKIKTHVWSVSCSSTSLNGWKINKWMKKWHIQFMDETSFTWIVQVGK